MSSKSYSCRTSIHEYLPYVADTLKLQGNCKIHVLNFSTDHAWPISGFSMCVTLAVKLAVWIMVIFVQLLHIETKTFSQ